WQDIIITEAFPAQGIVIISVLFQNFKNKLTKYPASKEVGEVLSFKIGVLWHKYIGDDPATAVYNTTSRRFITQTVIYHYAVLGPEFSILIPAYIIIEIGFITLFIGFLNRAACGGVISCNGQSYRAAISKFHLPLHKTFTIRTPAYNNTTVIIL